MPLNSPEVQSNTKGPASNRGAFSCHHPGTHRIHPNIWAMSKIPRLPHKDGAE
jgi:hypothetical protein